MNHTIVNYTISTTIANPFYDYYSQSGHSPLMISMYGILGLVCFVGIISNLTLVIITIRSKSLHGSCNFLLAFHALTSCGILFGYSVKFGVLLTGANFIPLNLCYKLYFVPLIGLNLATTAQLCIGIDRLLIVLFQQWYQQVDKCLLIIAYTLLCIARTMYYCLLIYSSFTIYPIQKKPVMCSTGDLVLPDIAQNVYMQSLILFISEFLCYVAVWIILYCRKSHVIKEKNVIVSLTVIMSLSLFGYIQGSVWRNILPYLHFDPFDMEYFVAYPTTFFYAVAFGSNLPILVIFSNEYRHAFLSKFVAWICGKKF